MVLGQRAGLFAMMVSPILPVFASPCQACCKPLHLTVAPLLTGGHKGGGDGDSRQLQLTQFVAERTIARPRTSGEMLH